ncbi:MAG: hypothetical protein M3Y75_13615 [Actinomycetota bacterium]|nr:hypothetical protein [Actinomycetota bacterium]
MKSKPVHVLLAAAMLALVVMPIAFAGAAGQPQAKVNASVKKQLKRLKQRLAAVEGKQFPATLPPSGPAGGDLTGTYPNPLVKANAIGTTQLADGAVTTPKIGDNAITTSKIADGGVTTDDLAPDSVGSSELKGVIATVGAGASLNANTPGVATVTCPGGTMVIGGGYAWTQQEENSIIASAPSESDPNQTWVVEGIPTGGSSNTLFAWANCLQL